MRAATRGGGGRADEGEAARRGTVIAVLDDRGTVQVAWTDGRSSYCLDYMVEEV